jgi:hypothetical protein
MRPADSRSFLFWFLRELQVIGADRLASVVLILGGSDATT